MLSTLALEHDTHPVAELVQEAVFDGICKVLKPRSMYSEGPWGNRRGSERIRLGDLKGSLRTDGWVSIWMHSQNTPCLVHPTFKANSFIGRPSYHVRFMRKLVQSRCLARFVGPRWRAAHCVCVYHQTVGLNPSFPGLKIIKLAPDHPSVVGIR
jgi:hypothetical protein